MLQHVQREGTAPLWPRGEVPITEPERKDPDRGEIGVAPDVALPLPHARVIRRAVQFDGCHGGPVEHVEPVAPPSDVHHVLPQETVETVTHKHMLHCVNLEVAFTATCDARRHRNHPLALSQRRKFLSRTGDRSKRRRIGGNERAKCRCALIVRHLGKGLTPRDRGFNHLPAIDAHRRRAVRESPDTNPLRAPAHASPGGNDYLDSHRRHSNRTGQEQRSGAPNPCLRTCPLRGGVNPCSRRLTVRRTSVDTGSDSSRSAALDCLGQLPMREHCFEFRPWISAPGTREPLRKRGFGGQSGHDSKERHRSIAAQALDAVRARRRDLWAPMQNASWARPRPRFSSARSTVMAVRLTDAFAHGMPERREHAAHLRGTD